MQQYVMVLMETETIRHAGSRDEIEETTMSDDCVNIFKYFISKVSKLNCL